MYLSADIASDRELHPTLADPDGQFADAYNRVAFPFRHRLVKHPLFELDSLLGLSKRLPAHPDCVYWSNGTVGMNDRWEKCGPRHSLHDTIRDIASNDSLVILKHVEQDAVLAPVLRHYLASVVELCGNRLRDDLLQGQASILIASPCRVTAYHIDADASFLLQLSGDKDLCVFDHTDRSLLTDEELEQFHAGDCNGAQFKPARKLDARIYELRAGSGVHIPSTAPHWAQTCDNVSVALSLKYDLRSVARPARLYRMNHRLRQLGLRPAPPGASAWRDSVKFAAERSMQAIHAFMA